ncbi:unnamed protein product [Euphydryas editha]|uniref:Uncharacterized protein n=1 Tax=Euphydryas editha TaxID=104508 RepID=A0AAU9UQJ4_EUPED|nr:unnamed protein product [Euphydryas editha]
MDTVKNTLAELKQHFNTKIAEFHEELRSASNAPLSATANIEAQFTTFRTLVLSALENLQLQVELLTQQCDDMEMRSRKKILLLHGVSEVDNEDTVLCTTKILSQHLKMPSLSVDNIKRCHRLGHNKRDKPRAILIKFNDILVRNKVWLAKTNLKGSGITLLEFLTKGRHETFMLARKRFGVEKCWTRDGAIIVLGSDGNRHRIFTKSELDNILEIADTSDQPAANNNPKEKATTSRPKRNARK